MVVDEGPERLPSAGSTEDAEKVAGTDGACGFPAGRGPVGPTPEHRCLRDAIEVASEVGGVRRISS